MWLLNFYMYENVWEHGQPTGCIQDKPLQPPPPPLTLTFSLVLSSSNISWISTRQSSCMLWKESWGMVAITASSMADSCSRMQEKDGRTWGSWSQHSGDTHESMNPPLNHTLTLASVWLYPPWAWQKVQGRWRGLVGLIYWQPHRKLQPDRLSHDRAPPQLAAPTAGHHSWRVERNGKRETGSDIINRQTWQMGCFVPGFHCYPQTSLPLEKREDLMTSGAIQE